MAKAVGAEGGVCRVRRSRIDWSKWAYAEDADHLLLLGSCKRIFGSYSFIKRKGSPA